MSPTTHGTDNVQEVRWGNDTTHGNTSLIINLITGGSITNLNRVDQSVNYHNSNLTELLKILRHEHCNGTDMIGLIEGIIQKRGIYNIDLRGLINDPTNDAYKELPRSSGSLIAGDSSRVLSGFAARKHARTVPSEMENLNGNHDDIEGTKQAEVLSPNGPHLQSISDIRKELSTMFAMDPNNTSWLDFKSSPSVETAYNYHKKKLDYYIGKMSSLTGNGKHEIRSPQDICKIYLDARSHLASNDIQNALSLIKILKQSILSVMELIRIKELIMHHSDNLILEDGYYSDQQWNSNVLDLDSEQLKDTISQISRERNELQQMIKMSRRYLKEASSLHPQIQSRSLRKRRSISFLKNLSDGMFTGYIKDGDIDVIPHLQQILSQPKLRISSKIFSGTYWPECRKYPESLNNMLRLKDYSSALIVYLNSDGICFFSKFCGAGKRLWPNTLLCTPASNSELHHYTNINHLGVSDYIHRIGNSELDDSLERKFNGYCSVGEIVVQKCANTITSTEQITLARLSGEWIIMKEDSHFGYVSNPSSLTSYDCTATNATQLDHTEHPGYITGCSKGDDDYLKRFKGVEDCSCGISNRAGDFNVKYYKSILPIDFLVQLNVEVKKPTTLPTRRHCIDCEMTCQDGLIKLTNNPKFEVLTVCKGGFCDYYSITNQKEDFVLRDPRALIGPVTFTLYPNNTDIEIFRGSSECTIQDYCNLIKCILCADFMMNPKCNPLVVTILWSIILIIPLLFISILSSTLNLLFRIIKLIIKLLSTLFRCCYVVSKAFARSSKRKVERTYVNLSQDDFEEQDIDRTIYNPTTVKIKMNEIKRPTVKPIVIRSVHPIAIILIFLVATNSSSSACSTESVIQSDSLHCSNTNQNPICTIKQDVQIALSPVGQVSCLNIRKTADSPILSQIQIKTKGLRLVCNPSIQYYTAPADVRVTTTYRCSQAGSCNEDYCKAVAKDTVIPDIPIKSIYNKTGESGCRLVNGFWGNTCFLADSACKFYRVFFESKGDAFEVFDCPTWEWVAELEITMIDAKLSMNTIHLSSNQPYVSENLVVRLTSVSIKPNILFSQCFLRKVSSKFDGYPISVTECNRKTEATIGKVGEIQCPTAKDADIMSLKCHYLPGLFHLNTNGNDLVFQQNLLDVETIYKESLLPKSFPGLILQSTKNGLPFMSLHEASLFTLHVSFKNYDISITEQDIECGTSFVNLTGCYKCDSGSTLCLDSTATEYPAIFRISCPNIIPQLSSISKKGVWCLNMAFNTESVSMRCQASCGSKSQDIDIKGKLFYMTNKKLVYSNATITDIENKDNFFRSVFSWLLSLSLTSYLQLLCSLLIGLLLAYLILWVLLPIIAKSIKRHLRKSKMQLNTKSKYGV